MIDKLLRTKDVQRLLQALLCLQTEEEAGQLLTDICTVGELKTLAQRLEVASLLRSGYTYSQVEEMTGASTATISRVKRFLQYGAGGYELVLSRMEE
ncbi:MAG: YerC/YecD family TrpR-related protein [Bacillota bacterium]|jgi:TrpR-related protein YerC/YecD